jgi:uncharacterized protein involved in exopolysaccharide biosynthesis
MKITFPRVIGFALMALGLALMAGGLSYYWLASDLYRSTARISISKPLEEIGSLRQGDYRRGPFWITTEHEIIRSKRNLHPVIINLDLHKKWTVRNRKRGELQVHEAYHLLRDRLEVRQSSHPPEIEISVWSEEPDEAAQIANEIARVYLDQRLATKRETRIQTLEKLLSEIEQQVLDSAALVVRLGKDLNTTISEIPLAVSRQKSKHSAALISRRGGSWKRKKEPVPR